jgi:hypothetical protein
MSSDPRGRACRGFAAHRSPCGDLHRVGGHPTERPSDRVSRCGASHGDHEPAGDAIHKSSAARPGNPPEQPDNPDRSHPGGPNPSTGVPLIHMADERPRFATGGCLALSHRCDPAFASPRGTAGSRGCMCSAGRMWSRRPRGTDIRWAGHRSESRRRVYRRRERQRRVLRRGQEHVEPPGQRVCSCDLHARWFAGLRDRDDR